MAEHKNVVVAVRCRPLNSRERKRNGSCLVTMQGRQTTIEAPMDIQQRSSSIHGEQQQQQQQQQSRERRRTYNFDYSYWSATDASDPCFASQETVFADIGRAVLDHALSGYHCCVFAYGQTGSGKSYTMMGGQGREAGLIPRICQALFAAIGGGGTAADESFHVEVSYLEIYNERVRDLLNPQQEPGGGGLRVREHPALGPYVEDLTKAAVSTVDQVLAHMSQGNKARTVAATNMNEASSRSHAVFTIMLTRRSHNRALDVVSERVARI
ncbi:Kinesin-like protein kif1b, partial [Coemansia sp. BCRC 34490]